METKIYSHYIGWFFFVVLFSISVTLVPVFGVFGLSGEQRELFESGIYYFDIEDDSVSRACTLPGSDNAEKVWNFFISNGYTPEQAAGILGNMHAESGVQPMRAQGRPMEEKVSSEQVASGTFPGGPAWGIVQWDPPTKMVNPSLESGASFAEIDSLEFQLRFLLDQLKGNGPVGEKAAGDHLKQQTTVAGATESFMKRYERPADQSDSAVAKRVTFANGYYLQYSSMVSSPVAGCTATLASGNSSELAQQILNNNNISFRNDKDRTAVMSVAEGGTACPSVDPTYTLDARLLGLLVSLGQNYSFAISSLHRGCTKETPGNSNSTSMHWSGKAVDISGAIGINGEVISGYSSWGSTVQSFIDTGAAMLPGRCEIGVPNTTYVSRTALGSCRNIFVDEGTSPHIHFAVDD